ncbi:MAG: GAF domain-containing sensor histidine kinase [Deltaproteobacteria bacterium]|nr:GAF domain-containing sensor histidine kinase [Deltaproteobacteria bacterium]
MDQLIAGRVIKTGKPLVIDDTSLEQELHRERDRKLGYQTRNLLLVPLKGRDRIIGALCAINKKKGDFDPRDVDLMNMIAGTVALSVENARVTGELKKAYEEVKGLNRAKDKVINHLSHELKTPVAILSGTLDLLVRTLKELPGEKWKSNVDRMKRNIDRIKDIQYEAQDIMEGKTPPAYQTLSFLLSQCADELETLISKHIGPNDVIEKVREEIRKLFGPKEMPPTEIDLGDMVRERIEFLRPRFSHRELEIITHIDDTPSPVFMPRDPLQKAFDGLLRNAIENTPDEGEIEVILEHRGNGAALKIRDYGVGIPEAYHKRIFEGFFATQDTMDYSSKRPFDFNAGGKGADLLRTKIFAERFRFKIEMISDRCRFIPGPRDQCPGRISSCPHCTRREDCLSSGGTLFSLFFLQSPEEE